MIYCNTVLFAILQIRRTYAYQERQNWPNGWKVWLLYLLNRKLINL